MSSERKSLLAVLLFVLFIQSLLGLFDQVESRQGHGEMVGHTKARISNIFDGHSVDCTTPQDELSDMIAIPEAEGCWHYRSFSVIFELIYALSFVLGSGYVGIKIFSLFLSSIEIILLFQLINRHYGVRKATLSSIVYSTLPMYLYYAQVSLPHHLNTIVILLAALYSLPVLLGQDVSRTRRFIGWMILIIGPFAGIIVAFAWAGFALFVLLHHERRNRKGFFTSICLVMIPVIAFSTQLLLNHILGHGVTAYTDRFSARSSLHSFIEPSFWILFIDNLTNVIGPIGIVVILVSVIRRQDVLSFPAEIKLSLIGMGSMLFWTLFFFQSSFVECCTYFAYPIVPLIAILSTKTFDMNRSSGAGIFSALIMLSMIAGLQLHSVPNNYFERPMQTYVIENITDEDATVVLDGELIQFNGFRFQLPNGSINIDSSSAPERLSYIIEHRTPDHIILSAAAFENMNARAVFNESGYCVTQLESDPHLPDHWVSGWMSEWLPIRVAVRCDS